PCSGRRLDRDEAAVPLRDRIYRGETQPCALTRGLRGEERFEDVRPDVVRNALPAVGYAEKCPSAGPAIGLARQVFLGELDRSRFDKERSAVGHRVAGIDAEIHQHLADLV